MDESRSWSVQVADDGRTIDVATASSDELKHAWTYQNGVADRLRLEAGRLDDAEARAALVATAQQHRRAAVRVYDAIRARGEDI